MRLFVAIKFNDQFLDEIDYVISPLKKEFPHIAWTKKDNIHLTLKFLGETKVDVNKISEMIGKTAATSRVFKLEAENVGFFDREQIIIWLGFRQTKELDELIDDLDRGFISLGFPKERRIYTPHVTLARVRRLDREKKELIKRSIDEFSYDFDKELRVDKILLMKSTLSSKGPVYGVLNEFYLNL